MGHIAAGRTDHVSPVRTEQHTVSCTSKGDGTIEWVTPEYALSRLEGYYRDVPPGWLEGAIADGTPLQTISFLYRTDPA